MKIPAYEIYALKYAGPFVRPAAMVTWFHDLDKTATINYYLCAILGGKEPIVVDCGCSPELARERCLIGYVNPVDVLRRINIEAQSVKHVILSHIHFDHISGIRLFPRATFLVQEKEYNFWIKNPMARRAPFMHTTDPAGNRYLGRLEGTKRLRLVRGDRKLFPGIELLLTPGHTVGHQVVAVNTAKGTAIVGSDAAHLFSSYRTDIPSALITDMVAWMKSYDKIRARASSLDLIFPGHDPAMLENFPQVAEDVTRLV
jgi:glyoxylase-like metal-dependent hydrolase (beta-lactamase superfamily II)